MNLLPLSGNFRDFKKYHINMLISSVTLPISVLSHGCMFIIDPSQAFIRGRAYIITKLFNLRHSICGYFSSLMNYCISYNKLIWNFVFRFDWGMFRASATYVGCVLSGKWLFKVARSSNHRLHFRSTDFSEPSSPAPLILDSELPFIERIIWYWRRTI
ncbi:hypothetical protein GQ457_09G003300 [Hibiscus cannabinus]